MTVLYHYTCFHGNAAIIGDLGEIKPGPDGLVWLTDMRVPIRDALGLTSRYITCDRMAYRWQVEIVPEIAWWPRWLRQASPEWKKWGRMLEMADGARPAHWYVAEIPVLGTQEANSHARR